MKSALFSVAAILFCVGAILRILWDRIPRCEHCGAMKGLESESSRTMYHWDGEWNDPNNPNRNVLLCRQCAFMHHEYWDEMWDDYNRGRL